MKLRRDNLLRLAQATLERCKEELAAPCPDVHGPKLDEHGERQWELRKDVDEVIDLITEVI